MNTDSNSDRYTNAVFTAEINDVIRRQADELNYKLNRKLTSPSNDVKLDTTRVQTFEHKAPHRPQYQLHVEKPSKITTQLKKRNTKVKN